MPLTREDKTARAISAALGLTTALLLGVYFSKHANLGVEDDLNARGLWTLDEQRNRGRTGNCQVTVNLSWDREPWNIAVFETDYDSAAALQQAVRFGKATMWLVVLLLIFRIVQLAVRLGFPKPSASEDEDDDPSP